MTAKLTSKRMQLPRPMPPIWLVLAALLIVLGGPATGMAKPPSRNILETPHNLSISGGGGEHDLKSTREARVCIFCHTPHHAETIAPLWSRESNSSIYIPYSSPTLRANPQQPLGASRICLSCHDGAVAHTLGKLKGGLDLDPGLPAIPYDADPRRNANLGLDLSDDHPISFAYLPGHPEMNDPATLPGEIRLAENSYLECTACHDPHNNQYGNFLVLDTTTQKDALCTSCHRKEGWSDPDSAHRTGGTRYPAVSAQVAAQGCVSCHIPHSSPGKPHLLQAAAEENNCYLACHKDAPYSDINSQFTTMTYRHPLGSAQGVHRANSVTKVEDVPVAAAQKHVECVDCHNPHRAGGGGAGVSGPLRGVRGVDKTGAAAIDEARYEYEICFKCHAGASADQFVSAGVRPLRQFQTYDESLRFNAGNPSFHPVTEDRLGTGLSLRAEYQAGMIRIDCTDCHAPHGSNEQHILRLASEDTYPSPVGSYPLCFACHDPDYLLNSASSPQAVSLPLHQSHVQTHNVPCSACHDPHGAPASRGSTMTNGVHLINFDTRYAGPAPTYDAVAKSCTVSCHAVNPQTY